MRHYEGRRDRSGKGVVEVFWPNGMHRRLHARRNLSNHSPTGFEWGYSGSGPAQLALALLADVLDDDERALTLHQPFKFEVVAHLPHDEWLLKESDIREFERGRS
jgi:Family of unknown function (DUF6166)